MRESEELEGFFFFAHEFVSVIFLKYVLINFCCH